MECNRRELCDQRIRYGESETIERQFEINENENQVGVYISFPKWLH
jgi:hypothetical protein